jgi:hypothetical protein
LSQAGLTNPLTGCSGAVRAASILLKDWSPVNPGGLKSASATAEKDNFGLLMHINGDYNLAEVGKMAITANSSYFVVNQGHIRIPDLPGTIGYTVEGTVIAVYNRLCHHPGYNRHSPNYLSTGDAVITCCHWFRISIYVVVVPANSQHCCCLLFSYPSLASHFRIASFGIHLLHILAVSLLRHR